MPSFAIWAPAAAYKHDKNLEGFLLDPTKVPASDLRALTDEVIANMSATRAYFGELYQLRRADFEQEVTRTPHVASLMGDQEFLQSQLSDAACRQMTLDGFISRLQSNGALTKEQVSVIRADSDQYFRDLGITGSRWKRRLLSITPEIFQASFDMMLAALTEHHPDLGKEYANQYPDLHRKLEKDRRENISTDFSGNPR